MFNRAFNSSLLKKNIKINKFFNNNINNINKNNSSSSLIIRRGLKDINKSSSKVSKGDPIKNVEPNAVGVVAKKEFLANISLIKLSRKPNNFTFAVFLIGTIAGALGSIVGLGGSFVALPLLISGLGIPASIAHGCGLSCILGTSFGGILSYSEGQFENFLNDVLVVDTEKEYINKLLILIENDIKLGKIELMSAMSLAFSASIFSIFGSVFSAYLTARTLTISMGSIMLLLAPTVSFKNEIVNYFRKKGEEKQKKNLEIQEINKINQNNDNHWKSDKVIDNLYKPMGIGVVTGFLTGVLGIGGGAVCVPLLSYLKPNLEHQEVLATTLASMFPAALSGSIVHYCKGTFPLRIAVPLGIGCVVGSAIGGKLALGSSEEPLKLIFSFLVGGMGLRSIRIGLKMPPVKKI